ncbi:hypothetical protein B0T14DRAFT_508285 [Immersiella caudata]|uniref:Uncharacterized protein n=1 Tax=Immersiella caudata TaxID=314043 RepID=A0AA39XI50_9PEZI|nr:hypothetical protein B0T14DRAFT_508285 [Immersiella caudata]
MSWNQRPHDGAQAGFSGIDDGRGNGLDWNQHPTYVNSLLQQEHLGFDNINSSTASVPPPPQHTGSQEFASSNAWSSQGTYDLSHGPSLHGPVDPHSGGTALDSTWGAARSDDQNYHHLPVLFMPALPLTPHPKLPKEGWTQAQQEMLIKSRQSGRGFADIAEDMRVQFGVEITPNALVKRFGKIQETHLGPLSTAINNVKPDLMASIKAEVDKLGYDALTEAERQALEEIMQEFHRSIPKSVQNLVYRRRKAEQSTASSYPL